MQIVMRYIERTNLEAVFIMPGSSDCTFNVSKHFKEYHAIYHLYCQRDVSVKFKLNDVTFNVI